MVATITCLTYDVATNVGSKTMLRHNDTHFLSRYETNMHGGNNQWADPAEAVRVGEQVGDELVARFEHTDPDLGDSPGVRDSAHEVLNAALDVVNYAALPRERRANILRGVINSLEASGALGGEPEWVDAEDTSPTGPGSTTPA